MAKKLTSKQRDKWYDRLLEIVETITKKYKAQLSEEIREQARAIGEELIEQGNDYTTEGFQKAEDGLNKILKGLDK